MRSDVRTPEGARTEARPLLGGCFATRDNEEAATTDARRSTATRALPMPGNEHDEDITLKQVQLRLGVAQHVLIHLCEKRVVEPDFADTSGRGKRRKFSQRNLFEFGVALALRKFELPISTVGLVVRLLRSFERAVGRLVGGFVLTDVLLKGRVAFELALFEGDLLVLVASGAGFKRPLLLGARIGEALRGEVASPRVVKLDDLPARFEARLQVDLREIARNVFGSGLSE